ncbi:MAG: transcription elongation factor GreA [Elusimicrobia bacterium]|nr:transcription elongation factor GreA [Elusimicrobiota bacterium]
MAEKVYLTKAGFEKLRKELESLKAEKIQLSAEIGEAAAQGDLRENFGYHAAKERQTEVLRRIGELEQKLVAAQMIESLDIPNGEVRIGTKIYLEEHPSKERTQWVLLDALEADTETGSISVHAPLSQGLLGHKEGERVTVNLPNGRSVTYTIIKIERLK